jgi:hypothetical protein
MRGKAKTRMNGWTAAGMERTRPARRFASRKFDRKKPLIEKCRRNKMGGNL